MSSLHGVHPLQQWTYHTPWENMQNKGAWLLVTQHHGMLYSYRDSASLYLYKPVETTCSSKLVCMQAEA